MRASAQRCRRRATFGLALSTPFLLAAMAARGAPRPMGAETLGELLRFYGASRQELSIQTPNIAERLRQRDREAARIVAGSDGRFADWPARGRIVRWSGDKAMLGIAVELAEGIGLQTFLGDDFDPTNTALDRNDPLVAAALASKDRALRVSGTLVLGADNGPFDAMAITPRAGREVSLITSFAAIGPA